MGREKEWHSGKEGRDAYLSNELDLDYVEIVRELPNARGKSAV